MKKQSRIITRIEKIWDSFYKHRYIYGLLAVVLLAAFQISGSSLGVWKNVMGYEADEGVLLGKSRSIRSDEWAALTPMSFSQPYNNFNKISDIVRGGNTDISLVYALPTLQFFQVFRPFQIGYFSGIIFGSEMGNSIGLSVYWCARLIFLFLVALDFFMIFTKKNKLLSTLGAIMISCAPVIQWWFAVNGIAEIFIFGMGLIVATHNYLNVGEWSKDTWKKKLLYLVVTFISIGGYALVLYPAWQIPMAYVFSALWIYIIATNRKKLVKSNVLPYLVSVVLAIISLAVVVIGSKEVISIVMNTSYPGKRVSTGGSMNPADLLDYMVNVFLPFRSNPVGTNQPESANFIALFPLGIIAVLAYMIRKKKIDVLAVSLIAIELLILLYSIIGIPELMSKLTLLNYSTANRAMLAVEFVNVFLLIYGLAILIENKAVFSRKMSVCSIVSTLAIIAACVLSIRINYPGYAPNGLLVMVAIVFAVIIYAFFAFSKKNFVALFAILLAITTIFSGMTVNPIRHGVDVVYDNDLMNVISDTNSKDSGRWVVDSNSQFAGDFLLMSGVSVINSVNTYPNLERWSMIDSKGNSKDIYNRYAWIFARIDNEATSQEKFNLTALDTFAVHLTHEDLIKLDVKYVMSDRELNNDGLKIYRSVCGWYIYKVKEV